MINISKMLLIIRIILMQSNDPSVPYVQKNQAFPKEYRCKGGFSWWQSKCKDVDECISEINYCGELHCTNTYGGFICGCREGFRQHEKKCIDIDECDYPEFCHGSSDCINNEGNYTCQCQRGFSGEKCIDTDECQRGLNTCDENAYCSNTVGSYQCTCWSGFFGTGHFCQKGQCMDDFCPENNKCVSRTGLSCECKDGFISNEVNKCEDIDECLSINSCDKNANCINESGSYKCGKGVNKNFLNK